MNKEINVKIKVPSLGFFKSGPPVANGRQEATGDRPDGGPENSGVASARFGRDVSGSYSTTAGWRRNVGLLVESIILVGIIGLAGGYGFNAGWLPIESAIFAYFLYAIIRGMPGSTTTILAIFFLLASLAAYYIDRQELAEKFVVFSYYFLGTYLLVEMTRPVREKIINAARLLIRQRWTIGNGSPADTVSSGRQ